MGPPGPAPASRLALPVEGFAAERLSDIVGLATFVDAVVTQAESGGEARLVRQLAPQFAAVLGHAAQGTDLRLNPEELGNVRLTVQTHDATLVLQVQADRPETTDLIRRHLAELVQEFRALGYTDVSVSLGEPGQDRRSAQGQWQHPTHGAGPEAQPAATIQPQDRQATSGLDLRL